MQTWALQDAKAHFSQVVRAAKTTPQTVTVHGSPAVVILSAKTYQNLVSPPGSLAAFLRQSPLVGELELVREDTKPRKDVDL